MPPHHYGPWPPIPPDPDPPPGDADELAAHMRALCAGRKPFRGSEAERRVRDYLRRWLVQRAALDVAATREALEEVVGPLSFREDARDPAADWASQDKVYHEPERAVWADLDLDDLVPEFTIGVVANTQVPLDQERLRDLAQIGKALVEDPQGWDRAAREVRRVLLERQTRAQFD